MKKTQQASWKNVVDRVSFFVDYEGNETTREDMLEEGLSGWPLFLIETCESVSLVLMCVGCGNHLSGENDAVESAFDFMVKKYADGEGATEDEESVRELDVIVTHVKVDPDDVENLYTIQTDRMGALHIWRGYADVQAYDKYGYYNRDTMRTARHYLQDSQDVDAALAKVSDETKRQLAGGYSCFTDRLVIHFTEMVNDSSYEVDKYGRPVRLLSIKYTCEVIVPETRRKFGKMLVTHQIGRDWDDQLVNSWLTISVAPAGAKETGYDLSSLPQEVAEALEE